MAVLNGYTGTVRSVAQNAIAVELNGGRLVTVNPATYPHLDYGWSTTTHKSQGRGDPLVIPTLAKNHDARSAHVALTRCETGLRVHTRLDRDELLSHLSSPAALRPKDDALLFEEIKRRTGGPDTHWATSVRTALAKANDPLREEHRVEMRQRSEARDRSVTAILRRFDAVRASVTTDTQLAVLERHEKRELGAVYKAHELESFVVWATRRRMAIERTAEVRAARVTQRAEQMKRDDDRDRKVTREAPQRGRGR